VPDARRQFATNEAETRVPHVGRPRAEDRTPAILEATKELLGEVGYDRLRIQDVADRAGAGLATVYRRWPTKQALVADALRHHADALFPPVDEDPRADLRALYQVLFDKLCGEGGEVLPGLLVALRTEPELASVVRDEFLRPMRERAKADLSRMLGPDSPYLDTLADLTPGLLVFRTVMLGEDVASDQFLSGVIDLIGSLAPAERRPPPTARRNR
jgi:AcrR family transcriptional regulator